MSRHCVAACVSWNCFFLEISVTKNAFVRLSPSVVSIVDPQITFLRCILSTLGAIHRIYKIRVLKMGFLQCDQPCGSSRLLLAWTFCYTNYKSESWNGFISRVAKHVVFESSMWCNLLLTKFTHFRAERVSLKCHQTYEPLSQMLQVRILKQTSLQCEEACGSSVPLLT